MVPLFLRNRPYAVYEGEGLHEVRKLEDAVDVVLVYHLPVGKLMA